MNITFFTRSVIYNIAHMKNRMRIDGSLMIHESLQLKRVNFDCYTAIGSVAAPLAE